MPSPISNIGFYSYLTSLLTPVPAAITWCLMESVTHDVVCHENDILDLIPFRRISCKEALVLALSREDQDAVATRWSDSYPPDYELAIKLREIDGPPTYTSSYSLVTNKSAEQLFRSITHIGGRSGWFHSTFLWRIRGALDRLLRGVGTTRIAPQFARFKRQLHHGLRKSRRKQRFYLCGSRPWIAKHAGVQSRQTTLRIYILS